MHIELSKETGSEYAYLAVFLAPLLFINFCSISVMEFFYTPFGTLNVNPNARQSLFSDIQPFSLYNWSVPNLIFRETSSESWLLHSSIITDMSSSVTSTLIWFVTKSKVFETLVITFLELHHVPVPEMNLKSTYDTRLLINIINCEYSWIDT